MAVYNFARGICNNGFLLWMPSVMLGAGAGDVDAVLAYSTFISVLTVPLVALLFLRTTRGSLLLCPLLLLASLISFIVTGSEMAHQSGNLFASLVVLLASATATNAVVSAYSAEVYSTQYRGLGTGVIAGAGKLAGIFVSSLVTAIAARGDPVREPAALTLAIMAAGVIGVALSCPVGDPRAPAGGRGGGAHPGGGGGPVRPAAAGEGCRRGPAGVDLERRERGGTGRHGGPRGHGSAMAPAAVASTVAHAVAYMYGTNGINCVPIALRGPIWGSSFDK